MAKHKTPADYLYKRYRIAYPKRLPVTTVSLPWLEHILLARQAGGVKQLSVIVREEAARLRESGDYRDSLSRAVLMAVRARLKQPQV